MLQLCRDAGEGRFIPQPLALAANPLPSLSVTSFGQFQIRRAGQPLPVCKSQKAASIFRYLLMRPSRSAGREELLEMFWPNASPQAGADSLHAAISTLRRYLNAAGEHYLLFESGRYMLNPQLHIADDRAHFLQLIELAGQCWRGEDTKGAYEHYTACEGEHVMACGGMTGHDATEKLSSVCRPRCRLTNWKNFLTIAAGQPSQ